MAPDPDEGHAVVNTAISVVTYNSVDYPIEDSDAVHTGNVYNGLDKTAAGFVLDARQGKALSDAIGNTYTKGEADALLDGKQGVLTFDSVPTAGSTNPVTSGGVYDALVNMDALIPTIINSGNYVELMRMWFDSHGAAAMTDFTALCDRWYTITRTGWTGGTRFYHASASMVSDGTKVGDNAWMVAVPSTNDTAGRDDYQDVPLFHCLDCNWILDENGKPHITAIDGVCGNFGRYDPDKLVGVIQMTGWCRYVDDAENDTYTYMYTDDMTAEGCAPLPEAVELDGTVRTWVVHGKYLSGDDYGCYSGVHPWAYTASHNTTRTNYHTKWGNQYGGKTSADDAFVKLMYFLKYGSLSADGVLQGCVNYNYQYSVAVEETGVERMILTASQANNIKIGSTVMVGNPTAFSTGTTLDIDRGQAGMRAKADRKKVTRKETLSSGNVAIYVDNGGVTFDTTASMLQGNKTVGPASVVSTDDAVGGGVSELTVHIEPVQSGSGDPSPENVRPISGWTAVNISVNGNVYNISFPSEAGTVYGGTLDVAGGTLTVDTIAKTLNGTEDWNASISANTRYVHKLSDALGENAVLCTNMFQVTRGGTVTGTCFIDVNKSFQVNPGMSSISEFKEFLRSNNLQVVYKIASPITCQLTPQEITLLTGINTVYADCGDITIQYEANIQSPTYVSTSPWYTGTCDNVKGADGSPSAPGNGTEPYILQGIECALGGYEVLSDTIIKYYKDNSDKYYLTYYICRDAGRYSTNITADYGLVDYEVSCPKSNSWQYIADHGRDDNYPEACFPNLIGCTSSQRTKDGMYILAASESTYEYLPLGHLTNGVGTGGLSIVGATAGLGSCSWYILARLSAAGNRGNFNGGE